MGSPSCRGLKSAVVHGRHLSSTPAGSGETKETTLESQGTSCGRDETVGISVRGGPTCRPAADAEYSYRANSCQHQPPLWGSSAGDQNFARLHWAVGNHYTHAHHDFQFQSQFFMTDSLYKDVLWFFPFVQCFQCSHRYDSPML